MFNIRAWQLASLILRPIKVKLHLPSTRKDGIFSCRKRQCTYAHTQLPTCDLIPPPQKFQHQVNDSSWHDHDDHYLPLTVEPGHHLSIVVVPSASLSTVVARTQHNGRRLLDRLITKQPNCHLNWQPPSTHNSNQASAYRIVPVSWKNPSSSLRFLIRFKFCLPNLA